MKALFVTGTDTGVGKTLVSIGLIAALKRRGLKVGACKPIETGNGDDGERLQNASGLGWSLDQVRPLSFALPAAPEVAATKPVEVAALLAHVTALAAECDFLVVEGAGGLLVPIAAGYSMAELARDLGWPLLVVGRAALGTINHTLLTVEAARSRGLAVAAIVLSSTTAQVGAEEGATPPLIARETGCTPLLLPHVLTESDAREVFDRLAQLLSSS